MNACTPDALIEAYSRVSLANQRSFATLSAALSRLHAREIDVLLLKGADFVTRLYGVRGLRPLTDADLLVHQRDLPAIDRLLREADYRPQLDGNPVYQSPDGSLLLDLVTEIWYTDDTEGIWRRAIPRTLGGVPVKGMSAEDLLIYLTAYVVLYRGYFSPAFFKDLSLLVEKEPLDWTFILEEAVRRNLKIPLYHGLSCTASRESVPIPGYVLRGLAPSGAAENVLAYVLGKLVTDKPLLDIGHFLLLITQPSGRKLRWVQRYFLPSRDFLYCRYGERGAANPTIIRLLRASRLMTQAAALAARILFRLITPVSSMANR